MSFFKKWADAVPTPGQGSHQGTASPALSPTRASTSRPCPSSTRATTPPQQQQQQSDYSSPPPQDRGYAYPRLRPPPATALHPADRQAPIPSGWTPRWDDRYQRWYYVEDATGRSQWEAPGFDHSAYRAGPGGEESRGHGSTPYGAPSPYGGPSPHGGPSPYGAPPAGYGSSGYDSHSGQYYDESRGKDKEKKSSGAGGMLLAGAGGLAVGAIAGAVIAHELTEEDSDNEYGGQKASAAGPAAAAAAAAPAAAAPVVYETNNYYYASPPPDQNQYAAAPPPAEDDFSAPPPGVIPMYDVNGDEIDSSDRESLREARDAYEEAMEAAADSDASSSDLEELEEARQEYEEEYEEAYYDE
ncbi:hypothetical protein N0V88_007932 [Collariella sp. IMI 366227]|nr:hypothetical protein N0V88_007932 [Collariella sp. IMI 366227]